VGSPRLSQAESRHVRDPRQSSAFVRPLSPLPAPQGKGRAATTISFDRPTSLACAPQSIRVRPLCAAPASKTRGPRQKAPRVFAAQSVRSARSPDSSARVESPPPETYAKSDAQATTPTTAGAGGSSTHGFAGHHHATRGSRSARFLPALRRVVSKNPFVFRCPPPPPTGEPPPPYGSPAPHRRRRAAQPTHRRAPKRRASTLDVARTALLRTAWADMPFAGSPSKCTAIRRDLKAKRHASPRLASARLHRQTRSSKTAFSRFPAQPEPGSCTRQPESPIIKSGATGNVPVDLRCCLPPRLAVAPNSAATEIRDRQYTMPYNGRSPR